MKKLTLSILGLVLVLPAYAEDFHKSLDAAADGYVDISNIAGSVTVTGWSRNEVEVSGTLGRNVEELIFDRDGDHVTIKVKVPKHGGRGIDSELSINLPQKSSIDVATVSADIVVRDVLGEQSLQTVSGDIQTDVHEHDISADSVSGDIEVSGSNKDTDTSVGTVSGDVTLFRVSGEVSAQAVSGDVIVDEGSFDRVSLNTVNGELVFQAELRKGGRLKAETVNGDIDLDFSGKVSAEFDIDTFNGDINNCFGPKPERTSKYAPGWELRFEEGGGDGRVEVSTMNGELRLCRD